MIKPLLSALILTLSTLVISQDLPKLSPLSKSENTVGLTKISLEYSRPSVRGRVIFGELVPYNEVWRLGANAPSKFTCSSDVLFPSANNAVLPAGTYAVFAFPSEDKKWKIVFNSDTEQWGVGNYDSLKNIVTVHVTAQDCQHTESLLMEINEINTSGASLIIAWDKLKVTIPFTVDTDALAQKNIDAAIAEGKDLDKVYASAANYYFNIKNDLATSLDYINKSIELNKSYSNVFLKARILYAQGDKKEALKLGKEASALAEEAGKDTWVDYINETISSWKD